MNPSPVLSGCGNFRSALFQCVAGGRARGGGAALIWVSLTCAPFRVSQRSGQECPPIQVKVPFCFLSWTSISSSFLAALNLSSFKFTGYPQGRATENKKATEYFSLSMTPPTPPTAFRITFFGSLPVPSGGFLFSFWPRVFTHSWVFFRRILCSSQFDNYDFHRPPLCMNSARKIHFWVHQGFMSPKALELPDKDKIASQ